MPIRIKCPRDTMVLRLAVTDQTNVRAGDVLMTLDDSPERKTLARLKSEEARTTAQLLRFADDEVMKHRSALTNEKTLSKAQVDELSTILSSELEEFRDMDSLDLGAVLRTFDRLIAARLTQAKFSLAVEQLETDTVIANHDINRKLEFIRLEQRYVARKIDRLSVKAPGDGRVTFFVGEHDSVPQGFVLAEIS